MCACARAGKRSDSSFLLHLGGLWLTDFVGFLRWPAQRKSPGFVHHSGSDSYNLEITNIMKECNISTDYQQIKLHQFCEDLYPLGTSFYRSYCQQYKFLFPGLHRWRLSGFLLGWGNWHPILPLLTFSAACWASTPSPRKTKIFKNFHRQLNIDIFWAGLAYSSGCASPVTWRTTSFWYRR